MANELCSLGKRKYESYHINFQVYVGMCTLSFDICADLENPFDNGVGCTDLGQPDLLF